MDGIAGVDGRGGMDGGAGLQWSVASGTMVR
jgi:hypothetical protein